MVRNEAEEGEGEGTSEQVIPKKRKEVTTSSILENFLLLATSLDDTVREEAVERALERESGSLDRRGKKSRSNSRDDSSSDLQTRLTNQLNLQRQQIRESVRDAIYAFSAEYDSESVRLGEEDLSGFEYDPDEQANLAKERWNIDDAIEKLRELAEELKMDCVNLGREMRVHEKNLTRVVDEIVKQKQR